MANRRSTSCKSTVQSDCSVPACTRTSPKLKSEGKRLNTFNSLPTPHNVGPIQLAKSGFIYEGSNSTVRCTNCRKTVKQWETGDNPEDQQFHAEGCDFAEKMDTPLDLAQSAGATNEPEKMEDSPTVAKSPAARPPQTTDEPAFLSLRNRAISRESPQPMSMPPIHIRGRQHPAPPSLTSEASEELLSRLTPVHMLHATRSDDSVSSNSVRNFNIEPSRNGNRRVVQPEPIHARPQDTNEPSSSRQVPPPQRNPSSTGLPDEEARHPDMRVARNRLRTFERNWSTKNIFKNIRLLVICGFFCLGHDDAVQCFYCNEILANWSRNDDPKRRHLECSPECRFAKGENCGDIPLPPEMRRRTRRSPRQSSTRVQESSSPSHRESLPQQDPLPNSGTRTQPEFSLPEAYVELTPAQRERNNLMIEFPCEHPMNEAMRDERARLQSLQNSPFRQNTQLRASNQTLAQAGLYYDGFADGTRCWCCGGGLKDYLQNDDPWVEHAKFYPECEYLLQQRGPAWVTSISIQHPNIVRPPLPQRELNAVPAASSGGAAGYGFSGLPMTNEEVILENAMQTHPTQYARNMGFPEQLIREVQLRRILHLGSCYQNAEALAAALLNPDADPATLEAASPQQLGISHSSRPQRQTITITGGNFIGPSIIDGHLRQPRPRNTLTINGMPLQEYLANQENAMEVEPEYSPVHIIDGNVSPSGISGTRQAAPSTTPVPTANPLSPNSTTGAAAAPPSGSAEERLEALQRELQCKICYSSPAQILFQPCGHICACADCARRLNACPVCRQRISRYLRTYPS